MFLTRVYFDVKYTRRVLLGVAGQSQEGSKSEQDFKVFYSNNKKKKKKLTVEWDLEGQRREADCPVGAAGCAVLQEGN